MKNTLLAVACFSALALAACNREPAEPAPAPAPAEPAAVTSVPSGETPEMAATFDQKGFAGTFSGGRTTLELKPDGTYLVTDGSDKMDGTWTVEEGDTRVRLDPNTKAVEDRLFQIAGRDELTAVTAEGQPASGDAALSLKRATAP